MSIVVPASSWALEDIAREVGTPFREALIAAAERARRTGHSVLAAYSAPIVAGSPVDFFAAANAAGVANLWYLERPAETEARVGFGVAAAVSEEGAASFAQAAARWRALAEDAVSRADERLGGGAAIGAFAGFAFDPEASSDGTWQGFPGALITIPRLFVRWMPNGVVATVAALVGPGSEPAEQAEQVRRELAWLSAWARGNGWRLDASGVSVPTDDSNRRRAFEQLVAEACDRIRRGDLRKVVAARGADVTAALAIDPAAVVERLRREQPSAAIFAVRRGEGIFVGATPERLARVDGERVETMALAGTAARGATMAEDAALAASLLGSAKNREEHSIVVEAVRAALTPLCADVHVATSPRLRLLPNVQHLETPIAGRLAPGHDLLDVGAALHPTPAVCGLPRAASRAFLRAREGLDRGWYAGSLGWVDALGQGELVVALRSALIRGDHARLFAGCGIVADSDPAAEYEESRLKLHVMLRALGGEA